MKKSQPPKRICVDMDEVMADAVAEHLLRYNRDYSDNITKADLQGKWIWDVVPSSNHPRLAEYLHSDDFFDVLEIMSDSQRVLKALQSHYEIFIASAAMEVPTSFNAKYRWLEKNFPFISPTHIVFCGDKGILRADYLIDDNPRQLQRFIGEGILYDAPHNAMVTGFHRVKSWLEIEELFLGDK
jgi:5'(3')-deoxyribonucleotidase